MNAKDNAVCGLFVSFFPSSAAQRQCPESRTPEKRKQMDSTNLSLSALLLLPYLCTASAFNVRVCEGYPGQGDLHHSGFHCPRLSDPPEHMYCCRPGNDSLKHCCSLAGFEMLMKVNLSEALTPSLHRSPLGLLGIGVYGLLVLSLMMVDFLYYYRLNKATFYITLSHSRFGKHLARSLLHRKVKDGVQLNSKGVSEAAKERMPQAALAMPDGTCDKQRPLEGHV
ncbi:LOW QUALITY PROTEIN: protein shisa-like-1a [Ascaphus truei]|uniref:LOW QUALITY PROTEIN: protein shisa-like-1a n=1 Tax=Ascaphus truei TaxID=8439 RepID=UPI003F5AB784